jgi:hypothetical protein
MRSYLLLLVPIAFLYACSTPDVTHPLSGEWQLLHYENLADGSRYVKPDHVPGDVVLAFATKGRKGNFEGHTVINPLEGKYELGEGNRINVSEIAGNLQRDPDWAHIFWDAFESASSYQLSGDLLEVYYEEDQRLMVFQRTGGL